jgi:methanogenic corrinoid protein MtbC1
VETETDMTAKSANTAAARTHPIQVVARRTGLTPDVIRVWERRYHAVSPQRAKGKRRLYTDAEVERLLLLRKVTRAGRRIGDVAGLSTKELRATVAEDERASVASTGLAAPTRPRARGKADVLQESLRAIEALDAEGLEAVLLRASMDLNETESIDRVVVPLMHEVGERWHDGSFKVAHEHLTTAVVRSFLGAKRGSRILPASAPSIVVTTPAGQLHEIGAMLVAMSASRDGWRVTYLGPNTPFEDVASSARKLDARAVALSIVHPADDPVVADELRRLRQRLGDGTSIVVGGSGVDGYRVVLEQIGALVPGSLPELRTTLEELRLQQL